MPRTHVIRLGDSIVALAAKAGLHADTIWNHPENASLRELRPVPLHLKEGDRVYLPDVRPKTVSVATGKRHVFRRLGIPPTYTARILRHDGVPRKDEPFRAIVDGAEQRGMTDGEGVLQIFVPPSAREIVVVLERDGLELRLPLGSLAPIDTIEGVQMRLHNLGYDIGEEEGALGPLTRRALADFQVHEGLTATGENDAPTRAALARAHDRQE
jgi:hypothetical protein